MKKTQEIQGKLDELWAGVIEEYQYDILQHKIFFHIIVVENSIRMEHQLIFEGVSGFNFYENSADNSQEPDKDDYLELTSIQYFEGGIGNINISSKYEKWVEQYYTAPNFVLEIWSSMLFIEANKVTVDKMAYTLK